MKKVDNKKKESNSARVMIIIAVSLLVFALLCAAYLVLDANKVFDKKPKAEETTALSDTTEATPTETESHANVETETNSDGTPKKVIFYKDNVYNGSIDYVYQPDNNKVLEWYYDADNKLIECVAITVNDKGSPILEEHSLNNKIFTSVEFNYYEDGVTLWQKTTTDNTTEKELVTKERYDKDKRIIEKFTYEDSVETGHIIYTYDENGNLTGEEAVS